MAALCLAVIVFFGLAHAWRVPAHAGDDRGWLGHSARGLGAIWTEQSIHKDYRPVFSSWLWLMQRAGADSPSGLALGRVLLFLAAAALAYWALTPLLPSRAALLAAAIVAVHPARVQHLLWSSAAADAICLCISMVCLGATLRAYLRRPSPWLPGVAVLVSCALAPLSKEIGLALPLMVLALPCAAGWMRRLAVTAAAAAGTALALFAALPVLDGAGRPGAIIAAGGGSRILTYPVRLLWPGDQELWFSRAALHGDYLPIATAGLAAAVAALLLLFAWRGRYLSAWAGTGTLLVLLGLLPWLIRNEDRGIGLGVVGIGVLIAGAVSRREGFSSNRAALLLVILAIAWTPLWIRWEGRWLEASRLSEAVISSGQDWREEAGDGTLLVALGAPARIGWHGEVAGIGEIDRCAVDLLGQVGPQPLLPVEVAPIADGSELQITAGGDAVFRWGTAPDPLFGIVRIDTDGAGRARGALIDREALEELAGRRGCRGVEVRIWDGERFSPSISAAADPQLLQEG
jgi:hypothetical protein